MNIKWDSQGDGPALLLIQGLGYGRWGWDPVVPGLAERHRVLSFDNRGIGESDKPEGPYTARMMADDALQVLDEAGSSGRTSLGASLGGMIAQELAVLAPERVDRLVLCCTTPGGPDAFPIPDATRAADGGGAGPRAGGRTSTLRRERARSEPRPSASSTRSSRFGVANPPDPAGWQAQAAAGTTFAGVDGAIEAPTHRPPRHGGQGGRRSQRRAACGAHSRRTRRAGPRRRSPLLLGRPRGVPRSRQGVPRVSAFTLDRWIRDRARNTPGARRGRLRRRRDHLRRARSPLRRACGNVVARGRRLDAHRKLRRADRTLLRVREGGRDPAPDLVAPRARRGRVPGRRRGIRRSCSQPTSTGNWPRQRWRLRRRRPPLSSAARAGAGAGVCGRRRPAADLHVRHDRQAEGRPADPRELLLDEPLVRPCDRDRRR